MGPFPPSSIPGTGDRTAACSKRVPIHNTGNAHSNNSPCKYHLQHPGLHRTPWQRRACEGQYSAENMQKGESLSVHKDTQILVFVHKHYLTELDFSTQGQHAFHRCICFS